MNKRTMLRAAALAALFLLAVILVWLCFDGTEESDLAVEIASPTRAADTPKPPAKETPAITPAPQAEETAAPQQGVAPMRIIQLEQATKRFNEHIVLNNITVSFKQGLIHGIIGRNGSGKTMLLKVICGFVPLTSGKIFVNNVQLGKGTDVPSDVGIIIETPGFLPNYSAFQNLKLLAKIKNKVSIDRIQEVMCLVGLDPDNKKHVSKLSMGMRQRLGIAQAIMENPSLLILDEPFNGLDANGIEDMRNLLLDQKERGKTILMASHSSEDIKCLCDNVIRMEQGRIT